MAQRLKMKADSPSRRVLYGMPEGFDALYLAQQARESGGTWVHVASDDMRLDHMTESLKFFAPDVEVLRFPAWDCLPYDRVSPTGDVLGERLKTLSRLLHETGTKPRLLLTTIAAVMQRVPPREMLNSASYVIRAGHDIKMSALQQFLAANGYHRSETVREAGEFALRGGLMDVFPSGSLEPLRIDCFGEEVESIRAFDPLSQRTTEDREELTLYPVSEVLLTENAIAQFRSGYREMFGAIRENDALYESISEARPYAGMEHWLPLFHSRIETLFDYLPDAVVMLDHQVEQARESRYRQIDDLYQARYSMMKAEQKGQSAVYRPVPVAALYLTAQEWDKALSTHHVLDVSPFPATEGQEDAGGRKGRDFGDVRAQDGNNLFHHVRQHIVALEQAGKKVLITAYSDGSRDRLQHIFKEHGCAALENVAAAPKFMRGSAVKAGIAVLGLEHGFESERFAVLSEQDILGDRFARTTRKKKKSDAFIFEISQLNEGDYVVHQEHGIGQFVCLETLVVDRVPHDCLKLVYAGGDKLFVPVENLDVLSRYGSAEAGAILDKLGGTAWQARRARVKRDLLALANELLKVAAQRVLSHAEPVEIESAAYDKFCMGFPYPETEDQLKAIEDVLQDLNEDKPMDRLICGDVGFGKTEVALRAAAAAALSGYQVALIAPTTLLVRQHYQTFVQRFHGLPVRIGHLSRLVTGREAEQVQEGVKSGDINIIIGTHALLSEKVKFANLGLMIVDEEQKFGVKQKERLKHLKENVHVLTLTATPIPRTLQMALTGVRELSLITTAPVDRLAVKTFVFPYDPVVIRDALMREHYRGGQTFYVCPRISDLEEVEEALKELVPELRLVVAHGQMGAEELEDKMSAFYEGAFDVLLSTTIVESGLDIPNANTLVIHRAEMFGLAQLYQLRGRVGRSKQRAYAYLTYSAEKKLTKNAEQRLHVIEQLDSLGAGFQLASHDLDIRGAGNLLGEEQSGHVKEIGVELYQQMLEEAVAAAKEGITSAKDMMTAEHWSPVINLGMPVLIPEDYVRDLNLRLSVYRRIADLEDRNEIESYAAELIDRFGTLPKDVENLLDLVEIKQLCRKAGIERIEAGPKGAVVALHPSSRIDIGKLVKFITQQTGTARLRPEDQKLVFVRAWEDVAARLKGVHKIVKDMNGLI